jgi:hypothetical protein
MPPPPHADQPPAYPQSAGTYAQAPTGNYALSPTGNYAHAPNAQSGVGYQNSAMFAQGAYGNMTLSAPPTQ